ncbi:MAG: hypothetical protein AB1324_07850 [Candidatus Micrarchaeota archaeon]
MALEFLRFFVESRLEDRMDEKKLEALREKRLARIIDSASRTKHYEPLVASRKISLASLDSLPLLSKDELRRDSASFLARGTDRKRLIPVSTSGSSGTPMTVYLSGEDAQKMHASILSTVNSLGYGPFDVMAHIRSHQGGRTPKLTGGLFRKLILHTSARESDNLEAMCRHGASVLSGYPSTMAIMAGRNLQNPRKLKAAFSGGEMLVQEARKAISESFSCPVYDLYACWELGLIASECREGRMHVHSRMYEVEILDGKGRPKKSGVGEVIVTSLLNSSMPLLRYRIGDRAEWGKPCPCGRSTPVLASLHGRLDDMLTLPSGKRIPAWSTNVSRLFSVLHSVWEYQAVQEREGLIVFRYVPRAGELSSNEKEEISQKIREGFMGEEVSVEFEAVPSIKRTSGKLRRFVSKLNSRKPVY